MKITQLKAKANKIRAFSVKNQQLRFYDNEIKFKVEKGDFILMINSEEIKETAYNY